MFLTIGICQLRSCSLKAEVEMATRRSDKETVNRSESDRVPTVYILEDTGYIWDSEGNLWIRFIVWYIITYLK